MSPLSNNAENAAALLDFRSLRRTESTSGDVSSGVSLNTTRSAVPLRCSMGAAHLGDYFVRQRGNVAFAGRHEPLIRFARTAPARRKDGLRRATETDLDIANVFAKWQVGLLRKIGPISKQSVQAIAAVVRRRAGNGSAEPLAIQLHAIGAIVFEIDNSRLRTEHYANVRIGPAIEPRIDNARVGCGVLSPIAEPGMLGNTLLSFFARRVLGFAAIAAAAPHAMQQHYSPPT